jgi:hypothetical protein
MANGDKDGSLRPTGDSGGNSNGKPRNGNGGYVPPRSPPGGRRKMTSGDIPAAPNPHEYYPDQVTLYGIKLNDEVTAASLPFGDKVLKLQVNMKVGNKPIEHGDISIAAVYGYSFEGHCYRMDKPRLFIFDQSDTVADGCGFEPPYRMWNIRSKTMLMEVGLNFDFAETLVLQANLPVNRAPNTYGNSMNLAHRNGRLGRAGGSGS